MYNLYKICINKYTEIFLNYKYPKENKCDIYNHNIPILNDNEYTDSDSNEEYYLRRELQFESELYNESKYIYIYILKFIITIILILLLIIIIINLINY
jgi:hypothetical protein